MKKLKSKNGITLIALIITIIILLILAMVTINILINQGIIGHANNAVRGYEVAEEKELISLAYQHYKMDQQTKGTEAQLIVDGANGGNPIAKEDGTWYITFDKTKHNYELSENGTVETAGERWTQSGESLTKGEVTVQIGDYVDYDCVTGVDSSKLYYKTENNNVTQEFKVETTPSWRVLGKDGKGRILLTTEEPIIDNQGHGLILGGKIGYIYGVDEIENISKIFGHGHFAVEARSINLKDINQITKHNPKSPTPNTYSKGEDGYIYKNGVKRKYTEFTYYENSPKETWKSLEVGQSKVMNHTADSYGIYTSTEGMKMIRYKGDGVTNASYWVAEQIIDCNESEDVVYFEMSRVSKWGLDSGSLYNTVGGTYGSGYDFGVRPVVTLDTNAELYGKEENDGVWKIK